MFRLQPPLPDDYSTAPNEELIRHVTAARSRLGKRLVILGHHYQREEVIQFADRRGDSFGLSRFAAEQHDAEFVVFCGVHFMAESADILTGPHQQVILPDLNAGCSMADMANLEDVEQIWDELAEVTDIEAVVPITYVNSAAALKAFVGRNSGAVCTSSNARAVLTWALEFGAPGATGGGALGPGQVPRAPRAAGTRSCSSPTSISAATPASSSATEPLIWRSSIRAGGSAGWQKPTSRRPPSCCGRAIARCISDFAPSKSRRSAPSIQTAS